MHFIYSSGRIFLPVTIFSIPFTRIPTNQFSRHVVLFPPVVVYLRTYLLLCLSNSTPTAYLLELLPPSIRLVVGLRVSISAITFLLILFLLTISHHHPRSIHHFIHLSSFSQQNCIVRYSSLKATCVLI